MVLVRRAPFGIGNAFEQEWKAGRVGCFQGIEPAGLFGLMVDPVGAVSGGIFFFGEVRGKG